MTRTNFLTRLWLARTSWAGLHYADSTGYARNTAADFAGLYR